MAFPEMQCFIIIQNKNPTQIHQTCQKQPAFLKKKEEEKKEKGRIRKATKLDSVTEGLSPRQSVTVAFLQQQT